MVRTGSAIYMMFVTLAGPLLCPCAATRFFTPPSPANAEATHAIASSPCRCCPRVPGAPAASPRGGRHPAPAQAPCPCPSHGHSAVAIPPLRVQQAGVALSGPHDGPQLVALLPWVGLAHLGVAAMASRPSHAFASPQGRLHAYCILRC